MFEKLIEFVKKINPKYFGLAVLVLVAVIGILGSCIFYSKYNELKKNPNIEAQKEIKSLVAVVGKLLELPNNETPTVATITDKTKLSDQPFFKNAENGDKLLVYNTALEAILYRPSINKIINVAPLSINQGQTLSQGTTPQEQNTPEVLRVAYYNGTNTPGLSGSMEKIIEDKYPSWQTTLVSNASKNDYKQTLIIDISKNHGQEVSAVAQLLNGKVSALPEGETAPNADILIISGK